MTSGIPVRRSSNWAMKPYGSRQSVSSIYTLPTELCSLMGAGQVWVQFILYQLSYEALWEQAKCEFNLYSTNWDIKPLWEQAKCEFNIYSTNWAMKPYGSRPSVSSIYALPTELWSLMGAGQVWVQFMLYQLSYEALWEQAKCEFNLCSTNWAMKPYGSRPSVSSTYTRHMVRMR